jgi:hypothetical protein
VEDIVAVLCTNLDCSQEQIVSEFVQRWTIETTFQEVRKHMRYEKIQTWADKGIERVSPSVMASYSIVCLIAARAMQAENKKIIPQTSAWYEKSHVTFHDVLIHVKLLTINHNIFTHPRRNQGLSKKSLWDTLYWLMVA